MQQLHGLGSAAEAGARHDAARQLLFRVGGWGLWQDCCWRGPASGGGAPMQPCLHPAQRAEPAARTLTVMHTPRAPSCAAQPSPHSLAAAGLVDAVEVPPGAPGPASTGAPRASSTSNRGMESAPIWAASLPDRTAVRGCRSANSSSTPDRGDHVLDQRINSAARRLMPPPTEPTQERRVTRQSGGVRLPQLAAATLAGAPAQAPAPVRQLPVLWRQRLNLLWRASGS
jgi:hypothetical protein